MNGDNLVRMEAIDRAWNDRDWRTYADMFDADLQAYSNDSPDPRGLDEHVAGARSFCDAFPDAVCHLPYIDSFIGADGDRTCNITRVTGRRASGGASFDITMAIVSRWRNGRVVEQRQYLDEMKMASDLGDPSSRD